MGQPKAWLPFGSETLLERVVRLTSQVAGPVVVVAAADQELPPLPGSILLVRDPTADRGPLQGLAAGLEALPETTQLAYATATDVPFLQPAWITYLTETIGDHDLALSRVGGYLHPLSAIYRRATVLPRALSLLSQDRLRPVFLLETLKALVVEEDELRSVDPTLGTLRNLNTPEDYQAALKSAGLGSSP
jgi:molybdopterin-guanine dinucleotide biosynthesis protein A